MEVFTAECLSTVCNSLRSVADSLAARTAAANSRNLISAVAIERKELGGRVSRVGRDR